MDGACHLETVIGSMTKYNRIRQEYPKAPWIDAACVLSPKMPVLTIIALGRGSRQMCRVETCGFPRGKPKAVKRVNGFQTGDTVRVVIEKGKYWGVHVGCAAVRERGDFDVATASGKRITTSWRRFGLLQRFGGYAYDCCRKELSV
jgi:hypothetical protein